ncbi:cytochrome P450 [Nocardioides sp. BGMRC 2183]|nr:cytochrome P450 [Nocardioides sp. BGMRC 2183]
MTETLISDGFDSLVDLGRDDPTDLHGILADLRRKKPYAVVRHRGERAVVLLTEELVAAAFRDEKTFPAMAAYTRANQPVLGRTIQSMTGREHRINKSLVSRPFRNLAAEQLREPMIAPIVHALIDEFADRGEADLVAEFTQPLPIRVIASLIGIAETDTDQLASWAHDLFNFPHDPEGAHRAAREFSAYVAPVVAERRHNPGDDLISVLVTAEVEGERLDDEQVLTFLRLLFPAGADTTHLALGNILCGLLTHPDQWALLRADPGEEAEWAVNEGLRWEPPVSLLHRVCPEAVTWQGIDIPADTAVIFAITAANRDPQVYSDPDRFDIGRRAAPLTTFGGGPHSCLGNWLAKAEMQVAVATLAERLPGLRLRPGAAEPVTFQIGKALRGPSSLWVEWDLA